MTEISLGKLGKIGSFDLSKLKAGIKKEDISDAKMQSIFSKVDSNNNGVLDQAEVDKLSEQLQNIAGDDKNLSDKEVKNFCKQNGLEDVQSQEMYDFLNTIGADSDKIDSAATEQLSNGQKAVAVQYKPDDTGAVTTEYLDSESGKLAAKNVDTEQASTYTEFNDDKKVTETVTDKTNGNTAKTEFMEDGVTPKTKTSVEKETGKTEVINYDNGQPVSKDVKKGTVESNYSVDSDGNFVLQREVKNGGTDFEEVSLHSYDGDKETVTTSKFDGSTLETVSQNGKKISTKTIKGDPNNPSSTNEIKYNDDGGRTETFTQPSKGYTQVDEYNAEGFKTKQTATTADGNTYEAIYDGKGHGTLTMKAGESIESFAQRVGASPSEIRRLNNFPGGVPQAGQTIIVPDRCVKATDSNNFAVNAKNEKAKGNAAEEKRIENTKGNLSEVFVQQNTRGKYQSYDEYAQKLIANEVKNGNLPQSALNDKNLQRNLASQIKEMNDGKDIRTLDSIKCPVSANYKNSLETSAANQKEINTAYKLTTKMAQETVHASDSYEARRREDGVFEEMADQFGRLNVSGENNYSGDVEQDLNALKGGINRMQKCLKNNDMEGFKSAFKATYGVEYDEAKVTEYYNNPTAENRKAAFGDNSRRSDIKNRVANYNQSQVDGGEIAKDVTIATVSMVTGGAGGIVGGVIIGAAVNGGATAAEELTKGTMNGRGDFKENVENADLGQIVQDGVVGGLTGGAGSKINTLTTKALGQGLQTSSRVANKAFNFASKASADAQLNSAVENITDNTISYARGVDDGTTAFSKGVNGYGSSSFKNIGEAAGEEAAKGIGRTMLNIGKNVVKKMT